MKKLILLVIGGFILSSCNNTSEKSSSNQDTVKEEARHHGDHSDAVKLNHGQKWVVNNEMKPFVLEGESLVNGYLENNGTDYKMLAEQIKAQNSMLVKSCTMTGESHDELHKWLHPHLELVKQLENKTETAESKENVIRIQESYQLYHQYFN